MLSGPLRLNVLCCTALNTVKQVYDGCVYKCCVSAKGANFANWTFNLFTSIGVMFGSRAAPVSRFWL